MSNDDRWMMTLQALYQNGLSFDDAMKAVNVLRSLPSPASAVPASVPASAPTTASASAPASAPAFAPALVPAVTSAPAPAPTSAPAFVSAPAPVPAPAPAPVPTPAPVDVDSEEHFWFTYTNFIAEVKKRHGEFIDVFYDCIWNKTPENKQKLQAVTDTLRKFKGTMEKYAQNEKILKQTLFVDLYMAVMKIMELHPLDLDGLKSKYV